MKAIKRAIILCWIMLIVCFIIKLFGGNWFEIICNNEHFINICDYVDNHIWLKDSLSAILYIVSSIWIIKAFSLLPNPNKKQLIVIISCLVVVWLLKYVSLTVKSIAEVINAIAMPIVLNVMSCDSKEARLQSVKRTWYYGIIGYALMLVFQLISLLTKNFTIGFIENNTLVALMLMTDYYIMIALYYLYIKLKIKKKKEKN